MSKEFVVVSTAYDEEPDETPAVMHMRFYEREVAEKYAVDAAKSQPGRRFYILAGASCWYGFAASLDELKWPG